MMHLAGSGLDRDVVEAARIHNAISRGAGPPDRIYRPSW